MEMLREYTNILLRVNVKIQVLFMQLKLMMAYQYFGDVVTFDATYQINHYKMSFVPFTGVNYHYQSMMFGCTLLVNETAKSYT